MLLCLFLGISIYKSSAMDPPPAIESYTFAMQLPPETDCFVRKKIKKKEGDSAGAPTAPQAPVSPGLMRLYPVAFDRSFRKGICMVREIYSDGSDTQFYFVQGWCAYDDAMKGLNIRRQEEGRKYSLMDDYHFPELMWAVASTQQVDPKVKEGEPKIHVYETAEKDYKLIVDAKTGYPLKFNRYGEEWTYTYKPDSTPIVVPEKLKSGLLRVLPHEEQ